MKPSGSASCPGECVTTITIATPGSGGRRGPWRGGGAAGEVRPTAAVDPGIPAIWTRPRRPRRRRRGGGGNTNLYVVSSDGKLHGTRTAPTWCRRSATLPPGAKAVGLDSNRHVLHAATTDRCGGAPNALWAIELANDANSRDQLAAEGRNGWGRSCLWDTGRDNVSRHRCRRIAGRRPPRIESSRSMPKRSS